MEGFTVAMIGLVIFTFGFAAGDGKADHLATSAMQCVVSQQADARVDAIKVCSTMFRITDRSNNN